MADITNPSGLITSIGVFTDRGTSTPDWELICTMNSRSFNIVRDEQKTELITTCGVDSQPEVWRKAGALDWSLDGQANLELELFDYMRTLIMSDTASLNVRVVMYKGEGTSLTAHGYYSGAGILMEYPQEQPSSSQLPQAKISIKKGQGSLTWTAGAPA